MIEKADRGRLDWVEVLVGAAIAAGVAITGGIAQRALNDESSLSYALLLLILLGMVGGGYVAGREPRVALTAGGLAAMIGAAGAQVLNFLYAVTFRHESATFSDLVQIVFIVLLSASFGIFGGYAAFRLAPPPAIDDDQAVPTNGDTT